MLSVREALGEAFYESENVLIYHVDSTVALDRLPKGVFDLIVTSPPYNIGKSYEKVVSTETYLGWCRSWLRLLPRVLSSRGAFWLNVGYLSDERARCLPIAYLLWDAVLPSMYLQQEVVWNYGAGVACKNYLSPRNEKFLWYVHDRDDYVFNLDAIRDPDVKYPNQKRNGKLRCNPLGKNPSDVWSIPKVTSGEHRASLERTEHPAQFPEALVERIVLGCSHAGELVLDPFGGSGTVAAVALKTKRKAVIFEIKRDYCVIARERIVALEKELREKVNAPIPTESVTYGKRPRDTDENIE